MIDMKKLMFTFSLLLFSSILFSQTVVNRDWIRNFSEKDSITNIPSAIDADGNIYVTGYSYIGGTNYNYTTIKYNQQGDTLWIRHYNGTGNSADMATAIALDNSGNVYVTGRSMGLTTNFDYATVKYNSAGVQLWVSRFNGTGNGYDEATAIAVDNIGNVFVTGYSTGTGTLEDYTTIKYNSSGIQQWVKTYNGSGNGFDKATTLTINSNNRIIVTGFSTNTTGTLDIVTLRYNSGNGNSQWTKIYNGSFNGDDIATSIINDGINVIICGSTQMAAINSDYLLLKLNTTNGNQVFSVNYDGYGANDLANSITIDNTGKLYVTGICKNNTLVEYHTIEYSNTGVQQWVHKYPLNLTSSKIINKVAIDAWDMIYICGETKGTSSRDFALIQLNGNGGQQWVETYNGTANGQDAINDMVVDNLGHVFVTGQTYNGNAKFDFTTIKYSQTPVLFPPDFNNEQSGNLTYFENKGQLINTNNQLIPDIRFYSANTYPTACLSNTKLSYIFSKYSKDSIIPDTLHRIELEFLKSNPNTKAYPFEMGDSHMNYYLAHCPQGVTDVKGFKRVLVPNIYPNIDLHYYSNSKGLKYYFVVKPGGNPKDIYLKYNGAAGIEITSGGDMIVRSDIGQITHERSNAYQINFSQNIIPLNWNADWVQVNSNTVRFNIGNYNTMFPLIIQVDLGHLSAQSNVANGNLDWSTYCPGEGIDLSYDVCNDDDGNTFMVGVTSTWKFPIDYIITQYNANDDAFVIKFSKYTHQDWGSYFGGSNNEMAFGTAYNKTNDCIYITGTTTSGNLPCPLINPNDGTYYQNTGYPPTQNIYRTDAYIARFNALTGARVWSSYFAGIGNEEGRALAVDEFGNVYLTGHTATVTGGYNNCNALTDGKFPLCDPQGGAFHKSANAGNQDIFLAKFDNTNHLLNSTFFGSYLDDKVYDIGVSSNSEDVYIVGSTKSILNSTSNNDCSTHTSNYFPLCDGGGNHFFANNGVNLDGLPDNTNAFISRFSPSGILKWSTIYPRLKEFQSVVTKTGDKKIIAIGVTNDFEPGVQTCEACNTGLSICNSTMQTSNNGFHDLYIAAFNENNLIWSTFYGSATNEYSNYLNAAWGWDNKFIVADVDNNQNLFIMGVTEKDNTNQFNTINHQSFYNQSLNDGDPAWGSTDLFIAGFNIDNQLFWSSLYGSGYPGSTLVNDLVFDFGMGLSIDKSDAIYIAGYTNAYESAIQNFTGLLIPASYPTNTPPSEDSFHMYPTNMPGPNSFICRLNIHDFSYSVEKLDSDNDSPVKLYPNPAIHVLQVNTELKFDSYYIYNSLGQVISKKTIPKNQSENFTIDISNLPSGIYSLTFG